MTVPRELTVLLDRHLAGHLVRTADTHTYRFRYAESWLSDPDAYPVSLALSLFAPEYEGTRVRYWLRGLLPDNEARLQEIEAEFGVSRDDPYAVLAAIGEDCVGAVQFAAPERAAEIMDGRVVSSVEWLDEAAIETLLREVAARASPHRRIVHTGQFSLPGALGKVALVWDVEGQRWGRPSGWRASTHILKPPVPGVTGHNENEHFCLQLARAVGLPAAASRVIRFERQSAIAVERYDRSADADGYVRRLHQEDMAQALGLDPAFKYASHTGAGIKEIVDLLRDYASPGDVDDFIKGVGYAWLTAGTDAHLRNFSLLIEPGAKAALAPLYDLSSALGLAARGRQMRNLRMAMAVGGHTALDQIGRDAWARETQRSRLSRSTSQRIAALAQTSADAAPSVAERLVDEEGLDAKYLQRLARAVAARASYCAAELGAR
ncbi:MAG TPA: HipA domain-containing protein [Longimicrobium sp.]|jgi:serine/threonine-protein kinase HipA